MKPLASLTLAGTLLVTGCGGATVFNQDYAWHYRFQEVMKLHGEKDMPLTVSGETNIAGGPDIETKVSNALSGRSIGLPIQFTPDAETAQTVPTRVEVLFNPAIGTLGHSLCSGTAKGVSPPEDEPETVLIAYCKRDGRMSSINMRLPEDADSSEQAFNDAFALAIRELLPRTPPGEPGRECTLCPNE